MRSKHDQFGVARNRDVKDRLRDGAVISRDARIDGEPELASELLALVRDGLGAPNACPWSSAEEGPGEGSRVLDASASTLGGGFQMHPGLLLIGQGVEPRCAFRR